MRLVLVLLGIGAVVGAPPAAYTPAAGPVGDVKCSAEEVEQANNDQLSAILVALVNTTYFRLAQVQLNSDACPFWSKPEPKCDSEPVEDAEDPSAGTCTLSGTGGGASEFSAFGSSASSTSIPWQPVTDDVDRTISNRESQTLPEGDDCGDPNEPEFWLDMCSGLAPAQGEFVNLRLNPEQYTGYNGSTVWSAIYDENCFRRTRNEEQMCYEERVLFRLLSGMHASTNIHIALHYKPPLKGKRATWEPNPQYFMRHFARHPERIKNLQFAFVVVMRAISKASQALSELPVDVALPDAQRTETLLRRLLDSSILSGCSSVFSGFDESLLFQDEFHNATTLKRQFKNVFQNISSVLDCVSCEKCKLHGKLTLLGLGTALKVLLVPQDKADLSRHEIVALVNTATRFSTAIAGVDTLRQLYEAQQEREQLAAQPHAPALAFQTSSGRFGQAAEAGSVVAPPAPGPPPTAFSPNDINAAVGAVAAARLPPPQEDALLDLALAGEAGVMALARHYGHRPADFVRHAVRNLGTLQARLGQVASVAGPQSFLEGGDGAVDVVVIGSGLAGLTTAITAFDRGASVVIVEKEAFLGGNSGKASSGVNGVGDSAPASGDGVSQYLADILTGGRHSTADGKALAAVLAERSGDALEFLRHRVGVTLNKVSQLGGHSFPRTYRPTAGLTGAEIIFRLSKAAAKLEADAPSRFRVMKETKVVELVADAGGAVAGVRVQGAGGEPRLLPSRAVVLATGGYGADQGGLIRQYRPDLEAFATTNGRWATGDGIKLGTGFGAGVVGMDSVQVHPTGFIDPRKPDAPVKTLCGEILRGVGGILLDGKGHRFVNELGTRDHISGTMKAVAASRQGGSPQFTLLLNAAQAAEADKHVPLYVAKQLLVRHDTLKDAAQHHGWTPRALAAELKSYNAAAGLGSDSFGKKYFHNTPFPVDEADGPFFTGVVTPVVHYTMGGLRVDTHARVLTEAGDPIGGLFAAGEVVGGIHGENRLGGNALTECVVFGRLAGASVPSGGGTRAGSAPAAPPPPPPPSTPPLPVLTLSDIAKHNSVAKGLWTAIHGKVYDLTDYVDQHPGGADSIEDVGGMDGTPKFSIVHVPDMLEDFDPVGVLAEG